LCFLLWLSCAAQANNSTRELPGADFRGTMFVMTRGVVVAVDKAAKKISIAHLGNEDLQIPAATTIFAVASANMLDGFEAGGSVFFIADRDAQKNPVVTRLAPRRANG
jgi:Cu/Ag efflux protein CusF